MRLVETLRELREAVAASPRRLGLVPTMGYLHEGHLSLIRRGRADCRTVTVSIFVNPTQFGPHDDLQRYPRDVPRDLDLCRAEGVDIVFAPQVAEMYPPGSATTVEVAGLQDRWEGEVRPGHFRGVATIVAKLLRMVGPDRAYFGEKDYQQLQVVTRMAADLSLDAEIVPCPTVRDTDGLALSSRNVYLTSEERAHALALPRALQEAQHAVDRGVLSGPDLCALMQASVQRGGGVELDYAAVVDPRSLEPVEGIRGEARALIAGRVGVARLIDNAPLRQS